MKIGNFPSDKPRNEPENVKKNGKICYTTYINLEYISVLYLYTILAVFMQIIMLKSREKNIINT